MNSLIQSLFMTPEFRRAVYNWSFDEWYKLVHEAFQKKTEGFHLVIISFTIEEVPKSGQKVETDEEFRDRKAERSIPLNLQRLFTRLQLSDKRAVSTKALCFTVPSNKFFSN